MLTSITNVLTMEETRKHRKVTQQEDAALRTNRSRRADEAETGALCGICSKGDIRILELVPPSVEAAPETVAEVFGQSDIVSPEVRASKYNDSITLEGNWALCDLVVAHASHA